MCNGKSTAFKGTSQSQPLNWISYSKLGSNFDTDTKDRKLGCSMTLKNIPVSVSVRDNRNWDHFLGNISQVLGKKKPVFE